MASSSIVLSHSAKRKRFTLLLGALFACLIALIAWLEFKPELSGQQKTADIQRIVIKRDNFEDLVLTRSNLDSNGKWRIIEPYTLNANDARIEPLLSLGAVQLDGYDVNEVDLPATGLDKPAASITIGERTYRLGVTDINGDRRYALVDGKVSLVPEWVWSLIHGGTTAFADLTVFSELSNPFYLISESATMTLSNPDAWLALTADKIAAWPPENVENSESLAWSLTTNDTLAKKNKIADIIRFDDHTLINTLKDFSYAISNDKLDALLSNSASESTNH